MQSPALPYPFATHECTFGLRPVRVLIPDAAAVQDVFRNKPAAPPPYWSKLWPASLGLGQYLANNPQLISGKQVIELAAGLGVPSLVAAQWASNVFTTDLEPDAALFIQASAAANGYNNLSAGVLDWNDLSQVQAPEVLLLSDINYDPETFDNLLEILSDALRRGVLIILSTPQRLLAKPFIGQLLPWCVQQQASTIEWLGTKTEVSILVLSLV